MDRSGDSVKVAIKTSHGFKLILAKKLVISIPPLLSNLAGFDLSASERYLFGQFLNGAYYTSLLNNTGIPDDVDIVNVGANTPYNLPKRMISPLPSLLPSQITQVCASENSPVEMNLCSTGSIQHRPNRRPRDQRRQIRRGQQPPQQRRAGIHRIGNPKAENSRYHQDRHHPRICRLQQPYAV